MIQFIPWFFNLHKGPASYLIPFLQFFLPFLEGWHAVLNIKWLIIRRLFFGMPIEFTYLVFHRILDLKTGVYFYTAPFF